MIGDYGLLQASFDLCIVQGLMTDKDKVRIAMIMEQMDEGIKKWRNASRTLNRQEQQQVSQACGASQTGNQSGTIAPAA